MYVIEEVILRNLFENIQLKKCKINNKMNI